LGFGLRGPLCRLEDESRILNMSVGIQGSMLNLQTAVIDRQGSGFSLVNLQSGHIRSSSTGEAWLIRDAGVVGIFLAAGSGGGPVFGSPSTAFMWEGAIDDCGGDAILIDGIGAIFNCANNTIQGAGNTGYGVSLVNGGSFTHVDSAVAVAETETLTGTLGDLGIDGNAATWEDLNNDSDKILTTAARSIVIGV